MRLRALPVSRSLTTPTLDHIVKWAWSLTSKDLTEKVEHSV